MSFSSLHSQSDEDFENPSYYNKQPMAGLLLQQFNDAWINNNWNIKEDWFAESFQFVTPLFTHTSFADFNGWFEQILPYITHAEIIQQYTHNNCTCCIVNINVGDEAAILRVVELVTFENNKISEIEWIYDPREVLDYFNL